MAELVVHLLEIIDITDKKCVFLLLLFYQLFLDQTLGGRLGKKSGHFVCLCHQLFFLFLVDIFPVGKHMHTAVFLGIKQIGLHTHPMVIGSIQCKQKIIA